MISEDAEHDALHKRMEHTMDESDVKAMLDFKFPAFSLEYNPSDEEFGGKASLIVSCKNTNEQNAVIIDAKDHDLEAIKTAFHSALVVLRRSCLEREKTDASA